MTPAEPQAPAGGDPDDALTWGDEADSSHVEGPTPTGRPRRGRRFDSTDDELGVDLDDESGDADDVDDGPAVMSSASLVVHGVLGGVFLLWAAGWIVAVGDFTNPFTDAISSLMWNLGELFAVAAPIAWFVAVIVLVPVDRTGRRLAWMALGALLVAPWPLVIGGSA
ncbi:hypothetical protein [Frigoribacterium sp. MEB024]|jgi:hypothetical protein|uniref:hypothetical protein n=1 Tax=Frigoribacterium sp. MEB024 TaxID=1589899 RepID=UPI0005B9221F|nr:hypothetical protein [Frigoribacterium sp. MEB024]KIU03669.1 hypothetical protein SZ60_04265 [Frigoribacterium sp. MEB024]